MITHKFGGKTYVYYTKAEADEMGLEYLPWREAKQGEWALTDDDYVAEVLRTGVVKKPLPTAPWVRIATGTFLGRPDRECLALEKRKNRFTFAGHKGDHKDPNRQLSQMERAFAAAYLTYFDAEKAFAAASKSNPATKSFPSRAQEVLRRANVQKEIDKGLREHFSEMGLDREWLGKQLRELGEAPTKDATRLKAVELVGEILGEISKRQLDGPATVMIAHKEIQLLEAEADKLKDEGREIGAVSGAEAVIETEDEDGHGAVREDDVPESATQRSPTVS